MLFHNVAKVVVYLFSFFWTARPHHDHIHVYLFKSLHLCLPISVLHQLISFQPFWETAKSFLFDFLLTPSNNVLNLLQGKHFHAVLPDWNVNILTCSSTAQPTNSFTLHSNTHTKLICRAVSNCAR